MITPLTIMDNLEIENSAAPHGHFVQFYQANEPSLNRNVANFLWEGLLRGEGLLVLATRQRRESLTSYLGRLGADVALARREGQLAMLDAHEILGRVMVQGRADWERFQDVIGEALQLAHPRVAEAGLSAYGELVGVLWEQGQTQAAIQLEGFWNKLLHHGGIKLFCGYPIDVFGPDFHQPHVHDVLRAHSHLMSSGTDSALAVAVSRAMDELLGAQAEEMRLSMKASVPSLGYQMQEAESNILWLRNHVPADADRILNCARKHYEQLQASEGGGTASHPNSLLVEG